MTVQFALQVGVAVGVPASEWPGMAAVLPVPLLAVGSYAFEEQQPFGLAAESGALTGAADARLVPVAKRHAEQFHPMAARLQPDVVTAGPGYYFALFAVPLAVVVAVGMMTDAAAPPVELALSVPSTDLVMHLLLTEAAEEVAETTVDPAAPVPQMSGVAAVGVAVVSGCSAGPVVALVASVAFADAPVEGFPSAEQQQLVLVE